MWITYGANNREGIIIVPTQTMPWGGSWLTLPEDGFMEAKFAMHFVSVIGHPLLIIWEYDDWCLGGTIVREIPQNYHKYSCIKFDPLPNGSHLFTPDLKGCRVPFRDQTCKNYRTIDLSYSIKFYPLEQLKIVNIWSPTGWTLVILMHLCWIVFVGISIRLLQDEKPMMKYRCMAPKRSWMTGNPVDDSFPKKKGHGNLLLSQFLTFISQVFDRWMTKWDRKLVVILVVFPYL